MVKFKILSEKEECKTKPTLNVRLITTPGGPLALEYQRPNNSWGTLIWINSKDGTLYRMTQVYKEQSFLESCGISIDNGYIKITR